jgi:hypothetical protein
MNQGSKRSIFRWVHLVLSIPILGYIYSPFAELPKYAPAVRFVFVPILVLSGLWMWKGHLLRRLISKRSAQQDAGLAGARRQHRTRRVHVPE